jgi:molybdopterin synthase sulfur carrier subunit
MMGRIVRVDLPAHLRTLAQVQGEVRVAVLGAVTLRTVVSALEAEYPMLCGTIREYGSGERRAFLRFFPLPEAVARGDEALLVVGAVAGGFG